MADRFTPNAGSHYHYDVGQRCAAAVMGNAANRNFKSLSVEQRSSPMCCDGGGSSDDILERSMKAAKVWEDLDARQQQQQQPLSAAAQFIGEHAVKIEQSRSLPSTPTGATVGLAGPAGLHVLNALPGHRMQQQVIDIAATPSSSHCRTSSLTMTMVSPADKTPMTPDSSASSLPRSMTLPSPLTDGGWNGRQRLADRNNNTNMKSGYHGALNTAFEMRHGSNADLTQYQHHVTMTPTSDDTTSPEDFIQVNII